MLLPGLLQCPRIIIMLYPDFGRLRYKESWCRIRLHTGRRMIDLE